MKFLESKKRSQKLKVTKVNDNTKVDDGGKNGR